MNSGSGAVTCCAFEEAASANAAIEKKSFFIFLKSVSGSWQRFIYYSVNCKVSGKGWNQTESSALIGLRIAIPPESSFWSTPRCVYIRNLSRPSFPGRERVQSTLWGIPVRLSSGWVCEVHECRLLQLRLNAVVHIDAKHHVCKDTKKCRIYQTFFDLFFTSKKPIFHFFLQQKKGRYIFIFYFLPVETRAMIFFLHEKNENLNLFGSNLPHNAYLVDLFIQKIHRK